jgi:hypothetical protein
MVDQHRGGRRGRGRLRDDVSDGLPFQEELRSRRIASGLGARGRVLVRADTVLVELADRSPQAVQAAVERVQGLGYDVEMRGDEPRVAGRRLVVRVPPGRRGGSDDERVPWSVEPLDRAVEALGGEMVATPNHVYFGHAGPFGSNPGTFLPHPGTFLPHPGTFLPHPGTFLPHPGPPTSYALPVGEPAAFPGPLAFPGHTAPRVLVLDTGLRTTGTGAARAPEHQWLADRVRVHTDWLDDVPGSYDDEDEPDDHAPGAEGAGLVDVSAGHGTFIAGIVRRICPDADIHVSGAMSSFGDGDDAGIAEALERAVVRLNGDAFDIIVMSFGTYTGDDQPPPLAVDMAALIDPRTLVVASAGNAASSRPQFPAAQPDVVAVGALDQTGRAVFSNFGGWVDACAPGVSITSTFVNFQETAPPERNFQGFASWSGTSFSAPIVAAVVATEMYLAKSTARAAWTRLSHWQKYRHPDLGIVVNHV